MLAIHQNPQNLNVKVSKQNATPNANVNVDAHTNSNANPNAHSTAKQQAERRLHLAQQCLRRLKQNENDAALHALYADHIDDPQLKCQHYLRAIELNHDAPDCCCKYIECLLSLSKLDEAFEFIVQHQERTKRALPLCNDALVQIANHKFENDEYEEALKMYTYHNHHDADDDEAASHEAEEEEKEKEKALDMDVDVAINIAYCYQQLNEPHRALSHYYKYLQSHATDIYCINNIAILEYYNKNYAAALQMYQKMSMEYIRSKELLFNIGVCYNQQEKYDLALSYFYKHAQSAHKNRDNCLISMAWIYCKKKEKYSEALSIYSKLSKHVICQKDLEFDIAWCYQQINEYKSALKFYKLYLKKYKHNVNTLHNIAWIYINDESNHDDNKYEKAKPLLIKILYIDKHHFYANYTYGIYLRDIERNYALSLHCLSMAHTAQPNNIQVLIDIAKIHLYQQQTDKAKSYYLKALKLNDTDCYANIEYAHFCALTENYKLSDFYYKKVLRLFQKQKHNDIVNNINMVENYTNYGHVLHKLGKNRDAIAVVKRAYQLNPNDCNTLNNLGFYHFCIAEYQEAEQYLTLCLSINPKHEFTNSTYANLLFKLKQFDKACVYYEVAVQLASDVEHTSIGPQMLYNYAYLLFKYKHECQQALQLLTRLMDAQQRYQAYLQQNIGKVQYLMAQIYYQLGSAQDALQCVHKALAHTPNNEEYQTLCKILEKSITETAK